MHSFSTLANHFTSCADGTLSSSFSLETSQVLWKQAEVHKGPERLSSQSGSCQCPSGQILHPRCLRHDRCKLLLSVKMNHFLVLMLFYASSRPFIGLWLIYVLFLVLSVVTWVTMQAWHAPWEPTYLQSIAWRLLAMRVWTCWREQ